MRTGYDRSENSRLCLPQFRGAIAALVRTCLAPRNKRRTGLVGLLPWIAVISRPGYAMPCAAETSPATGEPGAPRAAAKGQEVPSPLGDDRKTFRTLLPNGVHVVLRPERDTDTVAITVMVRMPDDTTPQEVAAGALVARGLFFGSMNSPREIVARTVAETGGDLETLQTPDYVAVTCVTVREQLRQAIYLLCEALKHAEFSPDALARSRRRLDEEQLRRESDGFRAAYEAASEPVRGAAPPDSVEVDHVTQQSAVAYFQQRYVPNRTVVAVVGDFDATAIGEMIEREMVDYTREPPRWPPFPPEPRPLGGAAPPIRVTSSGRLAYATVAFAAPGVASPDYPAYVVLQSVLGGGHACRLFQRIRSALGLGYTVGAAFEAFRSDPIVAYLGWDASRKLPAGLRSDRDVLATLNAQIDGVLRDPPTEAEVARARNIAIVRDALQHERLRDRAFHLAWYEAMEAGYAFDTKLPGLIAAVTRADVLRVAKTYLPIRSCALAVPKAR